MRNLKIIMKNSLHEVSISRNNLSEIKNDVYVFSGKELNDINDIKLISHKHKIFVLDELINHALINNNSIKISKQNIDISRTRLLHKNLANILRST